VQAIKALTEYLPFRVEYDPAAEELHDRFRLYRSFRFGRLAEIVMTDNRFYRSPPPEDEFGRRDNAEPPSPEVDDPDRTMLGADQRAWFIDTVRNTPATWTVWGNSVLNVPMKSTNLGDAGTFYYNYDAWDGYEYERQLLMGELERAGDARGRAPNLVTMTGDMHALMAAYMKTDYRTATKQRPFPDAGANRVGVEFMTPGISSAPLGDTLPTPTEVEEPLLDAQHRARNPHVEWFNWSHNGYTTVEFTDDEAVYTAYGVDASVDSADAPKQRVKRYRVPEGEVTLEEIGE
jgi:alkaline phosphatase D